MIGDYRIMGGLAIAAALAVYGVFHFPALTAGGSVGSSGVNQVKFEAVYDEELDYCAEMPESVDCRCFARISGLVRAGDDIQAIGAIRADRKELARSQAAGSC
ncbi:MAG: hypothetical protein AAGA08_01545 [Pseudomonadota bacterium]